MQTENTPYMDDSLFTIRSLKISYHYQRLFCRKRYSGGIYVRKACEPNSQGKVNYSYIGKALKIFFYKLCWCLFLDKLVLNPTP